MSRGLTSTITDELVKGQFTMAHLVSLELDSTYLFTDAPVDITPGGTTTFNFRASLTAGSTSATLYGPNGIYEMLFPNLLAGMSITDFNTQLYGTPSIVQEGTTIQSLGTAPNFTMTKEANFSETGAFVSFTGGFTYSANSFMLGLDSIQESSNINIGSVTLGISSVNQVLVSDVLNNGYLNKKVTIKRIFLDSNYLPVGGTTSYEYNVFSVYSGRIEGMTIKDSGENSMMELLVANHWTDFTRRNGRQTNNTSQQHYFPLDTSMEFAPQTGKKLLWGEVINQASEAESSFVSSSGGGHYGGGGGVWSGW